MPTEPHGGAYAAFPDNPAAYASAGRDATLQQLFQSAVRHAEDRINGFDKRAYAVRKPARRVRLWALLLFVLGTLAPVAASLLQKMFDAYKTDFLKDLAAFPFTEAGYVCLAIAGGLVIFDRFFDSSGSWIRFRQTQARLEVLLVNFRFEWAQLLSEGGGTIPADSFTDKGLGARCTALLRDFANTVESAAENETSEWARKFLASIDAFDQQLKSFEAKAKADAATQAATGQPSPGPQPPNAAAATAAKPLAAPREATVTVRVFVPEGASATPGSLKLTADGTDVPIDQEGYAEADLAVGVAHRLAAQGTVGGAALQGTLTLTPTIDQEGAVFVLKLQ